MANFEIGLAESDKPPEPCTLLQIQLRHPLLEITKHPFFVKWTVVHPNGKQRVTETDARELVQCYHDSGEVKVSAALCWEGHEIKVNGVRVEKVENMTGRAGRAGSPEQRTDRHECGE